MVESGNVPQAVVLTLQDGKSSVMYSKNISPENQEVFYDLFNDLATEVAISNVKDLKSIQNKVERVYAGVLSTPERKKLAKNIFAQVGEYGALTEKLGAKKGEAVVPLQDFLVNNLVSEDVVRGVGNGLKDLMPSDFNIANGFTNIGRVQQARAVVGDLGASLVEKGRTPEQAAELMFKYFKGMYASAYKIGDGRLTVDKDGIVSYIGDKAWEKIEIEHKEQHEGEGMPTNRKQVFSNVADFIEFGIGGIPGIDVYKRDANGNKIEVNGKYKLKYNSDAQLSKGLGIDTKLIAENSNSFIENQNFAERKAQALEARDAVELMMDFYFDKINNNLGYDYGDLGMVATSMGSGMPAVMRRAANAEYIAEGVELVPKNRRGTDLEYEHMIPQGEMTLKVLHSYLQNGKLDKKVWDGYTVAIIPKTMNNVLNKAGYRAKSPIGEDRYYGVRTIHPDVVAIRSLDPAKKGTAQEFVGRDFVEAVNSIKVDGLTHEKAQTIATAVRTLKSVNVPTQGITVLDFDDSLATTESNVLFTAPDGTKGKLNAEEFAKQGSDLLDQGYKFDFSEFSKVVKGKTAPLFQKALKLQGKFGPKDMFVLTARPQDAAPAIHAFLKANGLNIPLKNITGLENSSPQAKALWMAEKVGDGYNDFYFADDALQNVQAVKNILDQFDVKSKIQQARVQFSKNMDVEINNMIERSTDIGAQKEFSTAAAKIRGAKKGRFKFFIPPSAEDFKGLMYAFLGKGKQGDADLAFFKEALFDPFAKGYRAINTAKQTITTEFRELNKNMRPVVKKLNKKVPKTDFSIDAAVRTYLWEKSGFEIPGMSKKGKAALLDFVNKNADVKAYADALGIISRQSEGYVKPSATWVGETIAVDLERLASKTNRADFLAEWIKNKNIVFSEKNLNKIEAAYGANFREALEDILYRMETGSSRTFGKDKIVNGFTNWINGSVGAIMF